MSITSPGIRRLCMAVDLEHYSLRDNPGQVEAQRLLVQLLKEASDSAGLDRIYWDTQPTGDGEVALLPPGVDEARVIADFVHELRIALYQRNRILGADARLRLRVALHQGITHLAENGFGGSAVVVVCRLLNSRELKAALKDNPAADLVLIVSDQLYRDIVEHNYRDLRADSFTKVHVRDRAKSFEADAWIHVPTAAPAGVASDRHERGGRGKAKAASAQDPAQYAVTEIHGSVTADRFNSGFENTFSSERDE